MTPTTDREKEIAHKVDAKARAIQEGTGRWDANIIHQMKIAVGFVMTESEFEFLKSYAAWRRDNPFSNCPTTPCRAWQLLQRSRNTCFPRAASPGMAK